MQARAGEEGERSGARPLGRGFRGGWPVVAGAVGARLASKLQVAKL
jgi:hypothetical protein